MTQPYKLRKNTTEVPLTEQQHDRLRARFESRVGSVAIGANLIALNRRTPDGEGRLGGAEFSMEIDDLRYQEGFNQFDHYDNFLQAEKKNQRLEQELQNTRAAFDETLRANAADLARIRADLVRVVAELAGRTITVALLEQELVKNRR